MQLADPSPVTLRWLGDLLWVRPKQDMPIEPLIIVDLVPKTRLSL